jgi:hypothetical protein
MHAERKPPDIFSEPFGTTLKRICIIVVFSIAFGYIEAAVVVYLRVIFHPEGFIFPLTDFGSILQHKPLLLTEIGREAATIVLIFTGSWLFGRNHQQRFAYFLIIFAVWDIFYYVWLKVLINWPVTIMDWDILFLIPLTWASPVLYPVLISFTMILFALVILYGNSRMRPVQATFFDWFAFLLAALIVVTSFCIAGMHITEENFDSHFYAPIFIAGHLLGIVVFIKCVLKSKQRMTT